MTLGDLTSNPDFLRMTSINKRQLLLDPDVVGQTAAADFKNMSIPDQSKFIESLTGSDLPPEPVSGLVRALPGLAASVGGITGAALGGVGAPFGAALGGGAGKALENKIAGQYGQPVPQTAAEKAKSIGEEGAIQGLTEGAGQFVVSPLLKAAGRRLFTGARDLPLASGAKITTTPGMRQPFGKLALAESGAAGLPFGSPLRDAYATANQQVKREMVNIASRAAGQRVASSAPDTAMNDASLAVRRAASPMHDAVAQAMSALTAQRPMAATVSQVARQQLQQPSVQRLLSRQDMPRAVMENLQRMAQTPLAMPAVSGQVPAGDVWSAFKDTRSSLLDLMRSRTLDRSDKRVIGEMLGHIDSAMDQAIQQTNPSLVSTWREANRLTAQSYALEEVRDALRAASSGEPAAAQLSGTQPLPETMSAKSLSQSLRRLAIADRPGASTVLERALSPGDDTTIRQLADVMRRIQKQSGANIAVKFKTLAGVEMAGGAVVGMLTGRPEVGVAAAVTPELGAWLFARAMTSRPGRNALLGFLSSPAGTTAEMRAAYMLHHITESQGAPASTQEGTSGQF